MSYNTAHEDEFGTGRRPYTSASTQREDHLLPTPTTSVGADGDSLDPAPSARPFELPNGDASTICDEAGRSSSVTPTNDNQRTQAGGSYGSDPVDNFDEQPSNFPDSSIIVAAINNDILQANLACTLLQMYASTLELISGDLEGPSQISEEDLGEKEALQKRVEEYSARIEGSLDGIKTNFEQYTQAVKVLEKENESLSHKNTTLQEEKDTLKVEIEQLRQEQLNQVKSEEGESGAESGQSRKKSLRFWKQQGKTNRAKGSDEAV